jgi:hypothetical protein
MKKRTAVLINSVITVIGYTSENYFLAGLGVLCLTLVLISKSKSHVKR